MSDSVEDDFPPPEPPRCKYRGTLYDLWNHKNPQVTDVVKMTPVQSPRPPISDVCLILPELNCSPFRGIPADSYKPLVINLDSSDNDSDSSTDVRRCIPSKEGKQKQASSTNSHGCKSVDGCTSQTKNCSNTHNDASNTLLKRCLSTNENINLIKKDNVNKDLNNIVDEGTCGCPKISLDAGRAALHKTKHVTTTSLLSYSRRTTSSSSPPSKSSASLKISSSSSLPSKSSASLKTSPSSLLPSKSSSSSLPSKSSASLKTSSSSLLPSKSSSSLLPSKSSASLKSPKHTIHQDTTQDTPDGHSKNTVNSKKNLKASSTLQGNVSSTLQSNASSTLQGNASSTVTTSQNCMSPVESYKRAKKKLKKMKEKQKIVERKQFTGRKLDMDFNTVEVDKEEEGTLLLANKNNVGQCDVNNNNNDSGNLLCMSPSKVQKCELYNNIIDSPSRTRSTKLSLAAQPKGQPAGQPKGKYTRKENNRCGVDYIIPKKNTVLRVANISELIGDNGNLPP